MSRFFIRALTASAAVATLMAGQADAQIMRRPVAKKAVNWIGVNVGLDQGYTVNDPTTSATWAFGSATEYAARFEHPTASGISIGAQASWAQPQLRYARSADGCSSCEAQATVTQLSALLHYGQGYSFHGVYELTAGAIGYSGFHEAGNSNVTYGVAGTDYDFRLGLGYGLGFGISPTSAIEVVQEFSTIVHQKDSSGASNYPRVYVTRLGGKIAF